jgi:hypothetical protein
MVEERTAKEALKKCQITGQILPLAEIDTDIITTIVSLAVGDQTIADNALKNLNSSSILWNTIYSLYYDALHKVVTAYLRFDGIQSSNHICLFAYLCEKHPELELDWKFFEKIRTKRNGIHYYGQGVIAADWKAVELQMKLYIKTLKNSISKKVAEQ